MALVPALPHISSDNIGRLGLRHPGPGVFPGPHPDPDPVAGGVWYSASTGRDACWPACTKSFRPRWDSRATGSVNSVTAALSSSLLAALAIAAQLRMKHQQWLEAQAELQHTYEAMPIGLFTLN